MTSFNAKTAAKGSTQQSVERQLAELIDDVRVSVGALATQAAKKAFNPKASLIKFNSLIEKAISNIKEELDQAIANKSPQTIIDNLNQQFEQVTDRATTFKNHLNELASTPAFAKNVESKQGNSLSKWLDEISPLPEPEDFTEMPFQSLKADRTNIPRDFSAENTTDTNIKTRDLKNIDDFFLPEYVASTNETEITDDILAKAKELGNSPVKIYEWVRNNVEWQPTWGGQQTADMTLDVRRGNAMDISTLMITLLRAAKIPSRYVHGTVDIPVDNFINMAGDFETVEAAMDFVSAGGVPVTSITVGGKIAKVRIEHIWVEAAVPFYPSRGAKPVSARNPIDSWIPLDGSYKQYEYLDGIDALAIMSIDDEKLIEDIENSSSYDIKEGWVQGVDANIIKRSQQEAIQNLNNYLEDMQNPTLGNVIGGRRIIDQAFNMLPGSLPYLTTVRGVSHTQLIDTLQVQVTLKLGYDRHIGGFQKQEKWPLYKLNQRNIFISFRPATKADDNMLEALIPNDITDPHYLPNFLPSSIHVIPEIKRDEEVLLSSDVIALGEIIEIGYHFHTPTKSYLNVKDKVVAGGYLALGIVGTNLSEKTFLILNEKLNNTNNILDAKKNLEFEKLTREQLIGDMFITGVLGYYNQCMAEVKLASLRSTVSYLPLPTAGTVGYEPYQKTIFGLNRGIEAYSLFVNVRSVQILTDQNNNLQTRKEFNIQLGLISSMLEHATLEQMINDLSNSENKMKGFSTVAALNLAMEQGQKIFYINQSNQEVLAQLHLDINAITEIRNALATGMEVITHSEQINLRNYRGSGYIILDPKTGDGAYKISGGKNGAIIGIVIGVLLAIAMISITSNPGSIAGIAAILVNPITVVILSTVTILLSIFSIMDTIKYGEQRTLKCFLSGLNWGFNSLGDVWSKTKLQSILFLIFGTIVNEYSNLPSLRECKVIP